MEIELLIPDRLSYWCERIAVQPGALQALQETAAAVRTDPALLAIFSDFYQKTAVRGEWEREWKPLAFDPAVEAAFGERASLFYLLAYLAALPHTWQMYQRLAIGFDVFQSTMLDFPFYIQDYFDLHGRWGYSNFPWVWRHLSGELFRLGRLQFMWMDFEDGVTVLRRKAAAHNPTPADSLLLADPGLALRADGYAQGAGGQNDEQKWYPVFEATPQGWRGHRVAPRGFVEREPGYWPATEWELYLQTGDPVLDLHIPRADPLNAQTCGASYAWALEFFPRLRPGRQPKALFCHTWMFSPQLQTFLPPESNLVKFQREFYLFPNPGGVDFLWSFVFGEKYPDRATAPRDTSLRRAVLDWLAAGGEIFDLPGLMFHSPEQWGTQPYYR